jgi:hypothetical protein
MAASQNLPTAGVYVDDTLVDLFQTTIRQLIADFGRDVKFFLPASTSGCPNCEQGFDGSSQGVSQSSNPYPAGSPFNVSFPTGGICPVCKGSHQIKIENSVTHKSLISRSPKDFEYTQYGKDFDPRNVIKLKNTIEVFEELRRSGKALIDGEMYTVIGEPVKTGLRDLAFMQSFWMRQNV